MTLWFNLLCGIGIAISLGLILRKQLGLATRFAQCMAHALLWALVWLLAQPPAWMPALLPASSEVSLRTDRAKTGNLRSQFTATQLAVMESLTLSDEGVPAGALHDLPPVRLRLAQQTQTPAWAVSWDRELRLGDPLTLHIRLQSGAGIPQTLTLEDPFGNVVDSGVLSAESRELALRDQPKLAGRWEYQLRIEPVNGVDKYRDIKTDTVDANSVSVSNPRRETLPVLVRSAKKPRVLVWLARPGFETAALSRWLRQSGTPAQVVTQLAPEMQRQETFNDFPLRKSRLLDTDTPFDLLILDSRLWPQLRRQERRQLQQIVRDKSLLWLVHDGDDGDFARYTGTLDMAIQKTSAAAVHYDLLPQTEAQNAPELSLSSFQAAAHRTGDARFIAGNRDIYWARVQPEQSIGFVFFNNSYRWQTAGFAEAYARLWSDIFRQQLRWRGERPPLKFHSPLVQTGQRATVCSSGFTPATAPVIAHANLAADRESAVPLTAIRASNSTFGSCYSFWPRQAGWHLLNGDTASYVFDRNSWPEWQTFLAREHVQRMANARLGKRDSDTAVKTPIPRYWLALLLLVTLLTLWWRERGALRAG